MRTTLNIADDVLQAAKEWARREQKTAGQVLSELARQALTAPIAAASVREPEAVYGFKPFPRRGGLVTDELINTLRDDDAYRFARCSTSTTPRIDMRWIGSRTTPVRVGRQRPLLRMAAFASYRIQAMRILSHCSRSSSDCGRPRPTRFTSSGRMSSV